MVKKLEIKLELTVNKIIGLYQEDVFSKEETEKYLKNFTKEDLIKALLEDDFEEKEDVEEEKEIIKKEKTKKQKDIKEQDDEDYLKEELDNEDDFEDILD